MSPAADRLRLGLELVPGLDDVTPDTAPPGVAEVYADIRSVLRVPVVNFVFRAAANEPGWLGCAWRGVREAAASMPFERAADALRAHGTLPTDVDPEVAAAAEPEARAYIATIHYVLPKLLLVATGWAASLAGGEAADQPPPLEGRLPTGVAEGAIDAPMVQPGADHPGAELLPDIAERHGHPAPATFYRGLANWPGLLVAAWERVGPLVGSDGHLAARDEVVAEAGHRADELGLAAWIRCPSPRADWDAVIEVFRLRLIPDLIFTTGLVRGLVGGREASTASPFSLVGPSAV